MSVIDNKIVVAQPPDLIVYTDVDRNLRFDPAVDKREVLLTGFHGANHDHSLHSVTVGPDGKWVFNSGNTGAMFTDRSGKTFRSFGAYRDGPVGPFKDPHNKADHAGKPSDDGHVYVGGFTVRMNPDGTGAEIIGHNYRNSYEQSVTSLGDVFQNDNDDPPACRVSWVMEYANFGFSSLDGQRIVAGGPPSRTDGAGRRVAAGRSGRRARRRCLRRRIADRATSSTRTARSARRGRARSSRRSRDATRSSRYRPTRSGAGFNLGERQIFVTSNVARKYAGSDFVGGNRTARGAAETLFRPSDIAIGPDGALYVSDWIDPRVGGHTDLDDTTAGAIYRIAPKGFVSKPPAFDPATIEGLITALRSPAVNVRAIGLEGLQGARRVGGRRRRRAARGSESRIMRGRGLFLLYQLGPEGRQRAGTPESQKDPAMKIAAYRAMRRGGLDVLPMAARLARDPDAGVRREVALSLRDVPAAASLDILVEIARGFDGKDRSYLEALGTGATGKEAALYDRLRRELRVPSDPVAWAPTFAWIAWRLHPPAAVADLAARARAAKLSPDDRRRAIDALAFIDAPAASDAMLKLAGGTGPQRELATWWLLNRMSNAWADHNLQAALKVMKIYDPETIKLEEVAAAPPAQSPDPSIEEILRLRGDPARGKQVAAGLRDVPCDRRRRRRRRSGARRLGTRQVGRNHRPRHRPAERGDRAGLRRHGAAHDRRADHPGAPDQAGRSADDPQPRRLHADRSGEPRRQPPADDGIADDERGAARPERAGRRGSGRVPERELRQRLPAHDANSDRRSWLELEA